MKILMSFQRFYPHTGEHLPAIGGIERTILEIGKRLVRRGHQVTVITCSYENKSSVYYIEGIKVISCKKLFSLFGAPFSPEIIYRLIKEECDLFHAHIISPFTSDITCLFAKLRKLPLVVTYHCDAKPSLIGLHLIGFIISWLYNYLINKTCCHLADFIITSTRSYAKASPVLKNFIESKKIKIIPCGVDIKKFHPQKYKPYNNKTVLFVGRLKWYKCLEYLIRSMINVKAKLLIIGDGEDRNRLEKIIKKLNLSHKVKFLGAASDNILKKFYNIADIFVLPSYSGTESFGIVCLEAMACGKPVITTNIPGIREVVPKNCGYTIPPKNPKLLSDKINYLLSNKKERTRLGNNGRKFVVEKRRWEGIVEKYEKIYKKIRRLK